MEAGTTFRLRKGALAALLLVPALLAIVLPLRGKTGMLQIYMTAAERIVRGEEIYRPNDYGAFTYPPFFALPAVPLVPLAPMARAGVWWFVNLCLFELIVLVLARMVWPTVASPEVRGQRSEVGRSPTSDLRPPLWLLPLAIAALSGRFLVSPLEYQSHDLIVFALVMLAAEAMQHRRDAWAGAWAGLAAASKATPLLFLPMFCWQQRPRAAAAMLLTTALATLLADLLFPTPDGRPWAVHWYDKFISKVHANAPAQAAGVWSSWNWLNQGLSATVYRLTTPVESGRETINVCLLPLHDSTRQRLTLGLELLIAGWLAWCTRPRRNREQGARLSGSVLPAPCSPPLQPGLRALTEAGMLICAMLLLSPVSSSQHFGALLAPIAACATYFLYVRRDRSVAAVLVLVFLIGSLAARDILGRYACWPQAVGCKTWIAVALFLACGHILRQSEIENEN